MSFRSPGFGENLNILKMFLFIQGHIKGQILNYLFTHIKHKQLFYLCNIGNITFVSNHERFNFITKYREMNFLIFVSRYIALTFGLIF